MPMYLLNLFLEKITSIVTDWRASDCHCFRAYQVLLREAGRKGSAIWFVDRNVIQITSKIRRSVKDWNAYQREDWNSHDTSGTSVSAPCEKEGRLGWQRVEEWRDTDNSKDASREFGWINGPVQCNCITFCNIIYPQPPLHERLSAHRLMGISRFGESDVLL